jgi:hypothetical protein
MRQTVLILKSTIVFVLVLVIFPTVNAQNSVNYRVTITDPGRDGVSIYKTCTAIKGTASIPSSDYLWILVHRKDLTGQWWPQDGGIVRDTQFSLVTCFGQPQDIGMEFEVAVITVNQTEHLKLQNYVSKARETGNWYPISLPTVTSPAIFRTVIKAAHQQ